jgi:ABC-type sugar transport system substrate-binding protein
VVSALVLVTAACGSDDDGAATTDASETIAESPGEGTTAPLASDGSGTSEPSGDAGDLFSDAERVVGLATAGPVTATFPDGATLTAVQPAADVGVPEPVGPPEDSKFVYIVPGGPGDVALTGEIMQRAFEALGWETETTVSDFTPAGGQQALDTAIAANPDIIVGLALPGQFVDEQLTRARDAGIQTVNVYQTEASGPGYDVYVDFGAGTQYAVLAAAMLSEGGDEITVVGEPVDGFPDLPIEIGLDIVSQCEGCTAIAENIQVATQYDPVALEQFTSSILQSEPNTDYIMVCCGSSFEPKLAAIDTAGRTGQTSIVPGIAEPPALELMKADAGVPFTAGSSLNWLALAAVDATFRLVNGDELPDPTAYGLGTWLWTPENLPDEEPTVESLERWMLESYDFTTPYADAWGVDLDGVLLQ